MLIGALLGYACMSLVGLDVPMLTLANVELVLKVGKEINLPSNL